MKIKLLSLFALVCIVNTMDAQVLYSEDFDNLTLGNVGTDPTGTIPGQGGWYTKFYNKNTLNSDAYIANEINKGKVIALKRYSQTHYNEIILRDLDKLINQKNTGNNIIKLSFEVYTNSSSEDKHIVAGLASYSRVICCFWYSGKKGNLFAHINNFDTGSTTPLEYFNSGTSLSLNSTPKSVTLPSDTWVTLEIFIDYNTNTIYFSIPSLNIIKGFDAKVKLFNPDPEGPQLDSEIGMPFSLHFMNAMPEDAKFDNINISAVNTIPTTELKDLISSKFNLYPNPSNDIVNITNNENIGVEKIDVFDISGKLVQTKAFNKEAEIQMNISDLASGIYMFHIVTTEGTAIKKVIKK